MRGLIRRFPSIKSIKNDDKSKDFFNTIVEIGTVSLAAKAVINALKAVPIAGAVLNAIIAGAIVAALGEGCIYAFEQVYLGKKTVEDIDWVTKVMESKLTMELVERVKAVLKELGDEPDVKKVLEALLKAK